MERAFARAKAGNMLKELLARAAYWLAASALGISEIAFDFGFALQSGAEFSAVRGHRRKMRAMGGRANG